MIITKKEFKILKSNKINDLQKRKIARRIRKRSEILSNIFYSALIISAFDLCFIYALNGYHF